MTGRHGTVRPGMWQLPIALTVLSALAWGPATRAGVVAIRGGDLYTITDGVMRGGTLLIEDGKITKVGTAVLVPEGAQVIDATGKVVMPGLIAARMDGAIGGSGSTVAGGVDPYNASISFALASGITAGYVQTGTARPASDGIRNAVIKMAEGDLESIVVREPADVNVAYEVSSPSAKAQLRRSLTEAADFLRLKTQFDRDTAAGKKPEEPKEPRGAGPALQLLRGELPARISASSATDILCALELARDFGIHLILEDTIEGWIVAQDIARYDADVIMTPRAMQEGDDRLNAPSGSSKEQAAILRRAGIHLAIVPSGTGFSTGGDFGNDLFTLPLEAAWAVGGGLDEESALASITIEPARMLGVADRMGSLEVGKDGDVIVLNGHPLHYSTLVDVTLVDGKVLYERSKSPYFSHMGAAEEPAADTTDGDAPSPDGGA